MRVEGRGGRGEGGAEGGAGGGVAFDDVGDGRGAEAGGELPFGPVHLIDAEGQEAEGAADAARAKIALQVDDVIKAHGTEVGEGFHGRAVEGVDAVEERPEALCHRALRCAGQEVDFARAVARSAQGSDGRGCQEQVADG